MFDQLVDDPVVHIVGMKYTRISKKLNYADLDSDLLDPDIIWKLQNENKTKSVCVYIFTKQ